MFSGFIGFAMSYVETSPGVYTADIEERTYTGKFLRSVKQWTEADSLNENLSLQSRISIVADPFALENIANIKYVKWQGTKWRVISIEHEHPRLTLRLGAVYHG